MGKLTGKQIQEEGIFGRPYSPSGTCNWQYNHYFLNKKTELFISFPGRSLEYSSILEFAVEVSDFRVFILGDYLDSDGVTHHSSGVFFHGESIPEGFAEVIALCLSISGGV